MKRRVFYLHVQYYSFNDEHRKVPSKTTYHYRYFDENACYRHYENCKKSNCVAKVDIDYRYEEVV